MARGSSSIRRTWPLARTSISTILRSEWTLVLLLSLLALFVHGLNMFNFPSFTYKDDEGIYAAQAWAVLREGRLAPYTYWYDHAPAGWIMIAAWTGLTGGFYTFGTAIDSGRVLMLILHLAMIPLLYRLARKLGAEPAAAAAAVLLFAISPLARFYGRMLLLDTIMLFWVLLSLELLLDDWGRLSRVVLSGICFGLALLTKETAVFLLPVMLLLAFYQRWEHHGRFALGGWLLPMALITSWYPLFAALKGELLPAGLALRFTIFNIETGTTVSLIDSLRWQAERGGGGSVLNSGSLFWQLARDDWMVRDPLLFAGGALATLVNLLRGIRNRRALVAALLAALPLFYLARGGVVFDYYVLFALPFLCLNIALALAPLLNRLPGSAALASSAAIAVALLGGYAQAGTLQPLYTQRPSDAGRQAAAWIKRNLPPESRIITRDDLWTDLREPGPDGPGFPNVHSHWKVAGDPEVRSGVFHDDWRRVDYLIMSPGLDAAFADTNDQVALEALQHAHEVRRWSVDGTELSLFKVDQPGVTEQLLLADAAGTIARRFEEDGAFTDSAGAVTSEAQSYAMLRAVWMDDRAAFDRAWVWTKGHLLDERGLPAWKWQDDRVADRHTASDADTDTALALLMASRRWNDAELRAAGTAMARAIWEQEVVVVDGRPYMTAGDWATEGPVLALNPSYLAPYAYRIFQEVDPAHDWQALVDSSYQVLFDSASGTLGAERSAGLPPDWVGLDASTGELVPLELEGRDTTSYGYDAPRAFWRLALDWRWHQDGRADAFLQQATFLSDEVDRKGATSAVYTHSGEVAQELPSMVGTAGAIAVLSRNNPDLAAALYARQVVGEASRSGDDVLWGDTSDLYGQEWGWFAVALHADQLPDLWRQPPTAARANP